MRRNASYCSGLVCPSGNIGRLSHGGRRRANSLAEQHPPTEPGGIRAASPVDRSARVASCPFNLGPGRRAPQVEHAAHSRHRTQHIAVGGERRGVENAGLGLQGQQFLLALEIPEFECLPCVAGCTFGCRTRPCQGSRPSHGCPHVSLDIAASARPRNGRSSRLSKKRVRPLPRLARSRSNPRLA
jgi:hypothetical protein